MWKYDILIASKCDFVLYVLGDRPSSDGKDVQKLIFSVDNLTQECVDNLDYALPETNKK